MFNHPSTLHGYTSLLTNLVLRPTKDLLEPMATKLLLQLFIVMLINIRNTRSRLTEKHFAHNTRRKQHCEYKY